MHPAKSACAPVQYDTGVRIVANNQSWNLKILSKNYLQSNLNGSNFFGTMEIRLKHG